MRAVVLLVLGTLAGCGSPEQPTAPETASSETPAPPAPLSSPTQPSPPALTPIPQPTQDLAVLDSRDCRTVAQAYFGALSRGDYAFAARVWDDPVIDGARLKALFAGYKAPTVAIGGLQQEGAAGSSYCTVGGTLTDSGDTSKPASKGEIVLKRVNDVPGATPEQLRWTIRSSTFVEKMERTS